MNEPPLCLDQQQQWDAEEVDRLRRSLAILAAGVRTAQVEAAERKDQWRQARLTRRQADRALAEAIEQQDGLTDQQYVRTLTQLADAAEAVAEAERQARQERDLAVQRLRRLQLDLRVTVKRKLEPLPLFDQHRDEPPLLPMVDDRTPEQLRADGDDVWPDGTPRPEKPKRARKRKGASGE